MPQLLQHIDAIAREKNRDVLFVHFENYKQHAQDPDAIRQNFMGWLEQHNIGFKACFGIEQNETLETYSGDLYIDVPFDISNPDFQVLSEYLEDEQGNMKIDGILFFTLSLELALEIEADRQAGLDPQIHDGFNDDDWDGVPS